LVKPKTLKGIKTVLRYIILIVEDIDKGYEYNDNIDIFTQCLDLIKIIMINVTQEQFFELKSLIQDAVKTILHENLSHLFKKSDRYMDEINNIIDTGDYGN